MANFFECLAMSRIEAAQNPATEDEAPRGRPLWPGVLILAGVGASILWVLLLGWWRASAVAAMI